MTTPRDDNAPANGLKESERPVNPQTFALWLVFSGRERDLVPMMTSNPDGFKKETGIDLSLPDVKKARKFIEANDGGSSGNRMSTVRNLFHQMSDDLGYPDGGCPKSPQISGLSASPKIAAPIK